MLIDVNPGIVLSSLTRLDCTVVDRSRSNVQPPAVTPWTSSRPQLSWRSTLAGPANVPDRDSNVDCPVSLPQTSPGKPCPPTVRKAPAIRPNVAATTMLPRNSNGVRPRTMPTPMPRMISGHRPHQAATWSVVSAPARTARGTAPSTMKKTPQPRNRRLMCIPNGPFLRESRQGEPTASPNRRMG